MLGAREHIVYVLNMAENTLSTTDLNPSTTSQRKKGADRKEYYANRDASKIYLFDLFPRWKALKDEKNLRSDKDVAQLLLDAYESENKLR